MDLFSSAWLSALLVGIVFLLSGALKLISWTRFRDTLSAMEVLPSRLARGVGWVLPPLEADPGSACHPANAGRAWQQALPDLGLEPVGLDPGPVGPDPEKTLGFVMARLGDADCDGRSCRISPVVECLPVPGGNQAG